MDASTYTDCRMIEDGSGRWLWQLLTDTQLLGAGVVMSESDAHRAAEQAVIDLADKSDCLQAATGGPEWGTTHLDLDALERIDRELRDQEGGGQGESRKGQGT